jgi:hypothetical protein
VIGLYLLAAHLVGDFLLQTRWQAAQKLVSARVRARHVAAYLIPFVVLLAYLRPSWGRAVAFVCLLAVLHFLTDSRRFTSTPGEWVVWAVRRERYGLLVPPLDPNPWPAMPLMIDQSLHVVQIAVLGGLLLA